MAPKETSPGTIFGPKNWWAPGGPFQGARPGHRRIPQKLVKNTPRPRLCRRTFKRLDPWARPTRPTRIRSANPEGSGGSQQSSPKGSVQLFGGIGLGHSWPSVLGVPKPTNTRPSDRAHAGSIDRFRSRFAPVLEPNLCNYIFYSKTM